MHQVTLKINGRDDREFRLIFPDHPLKNIDPPLHKEQQEQWLEFIATVCYQRIVADATSSPRLMNCSKVLVFVSHLILNKNAVDQTTAATLQYTYTTNNVRFSQPAILDINLAEKNSLKYVVDKTPTVEFSEEEANRVFSENFTDASFQAWSALPAVKIQQRVLLGSSPLLQLAPAMQPVDMMEAPDQKPAEIIKNLCIRCNPNLSELVIEHLIGARDLFYELYPLINTEIPLYQEWINENLKIPKGDMIKNALTPFVEKQKSRLLNLIIENQKLKIREFIEENNDAYAQFISESQPNDYLCEMRKLHYIRKNIVIALYNAARDYYIKIQGYANKEDGQENLSDSIRRFNKIFYKIASINPHTLELSSGAEALKILDQLPTLSGPLSLETMVDNILKEAAQLNDNNSIKTSFGDAYGFIQERLNSFNRTVHPNPGYLGSNIAALGEIFEPVTAPADGTALRKFTATSRLADTSYSMLQKIKTATGNQTVLFKFKDNIANIEKNIAENEKTFPAILINLNERLATLYEDAKKIIQEVDKTLKFECDLSFKNLLACADLLASHEKYTNTFEILDEKYNELFNILSPIQFKNTLLQQRVTEYGMTDEQLANFRDQIFAGEQLNSIDILLETLGIAKNQISESFDLLQTSMEEAKQSDSQRTENNKFAHAELMQAIEQNRQEADQTIEDVDKSVRIYFHKLDFGKTCIDNFISCDQAIDNIDAFHASYVMRDLTPLFNDRESPLPTGITLYQQAEEAYQGLVDNMAAKEQAFTAYLAEENIAINLIHTKGQQALENAKKSMENYRNDLCAVLLCNMIIQAIHNFEYWQQAAGVLDAKTNLLVDNRLYRVPVCIYSLTQLVSDGAYADWDTNAVTARKLLAALQQQISHARGGAEIRHFFALINRTIYSSSQEENANLLAIRDYLQDFNRDRRNKLILPGITLKRRSTLPPIEHQPRLLDKYPNVKNALIGAAIGLAIVALAAIVITVCVYTGGAPIIVVAAGTVLTVGGAGFGAFIIAAAAVVSTALGALIGFFASKTYQQPQLKTMPAVADENLIYRNRQVPSVRRPASITTPARNLEPVRSTVAASRHRAQTASHSAPVSSHLSPLSSRLAPLSGHLSPLSGRLAPLGGHLSPLSGRLPPLGSRLAPLSSHPERSEGSPSKPNTEIPRSARNDNNNSGNANNNSGNANNNSGNANNSRSDNSSLCDNDSRCDNNSLCDNDSRSDNNSRCDNDSRCDNSNSRTDNTTALNITGSAESESRPALHVSRPGQKGHRHPVRRTGENSEGSKSFMTDSHHQKRRGKSRIAVIADDSGSDKETLTK